MIKNLYWYFLKYTLNLTDSDETSILAAKFQEIIKYKI